MYKNAVPKKTQIALAGTYTQDLGKEGYKVEKVEYILKQIFKYLMN